MLIRAFASLLLAAACALGAAESLEERLKATDLSNADAVFELAQWCGQNGLPAKARAYYNQVIKLDKDHEGARNALGQVKVGERWVAAGATPGGAVKRPEGAATGGAGDAGPSRQASGTPPTAEQIAWDLKLPLDPQPANTWINQYINKLNTVGNDSDDMAVAVATMLQDEQVDKSLPRLCVKLTEPTFTDLYGASDMVNELMRVGRTAKAKQLLPFLMKASERVNDPGDLAAFAFAVGQLKDKRVVPRLIQLLESVNAEVKDGAANGLQMVTLLPLEQITPEKVKQWWALNYNVGDQQIYQEQLRSSDPRVAVEAAKALYEFRDRSIVPVLARLMRGDDRIVATEAIAVVKRITGNDWSYNPEDPADKRKKRADELEKWWKEEQNRFTWIQDREKAAAPGSAPAAAVDPALEWIRQLGSATATEAATAESNLAGAGSKGVPALIAGLDDGNRLVRRKCQELLERVTKQKLPYDAAAEADARAPQIAAWREWAVKQGLMPGEGGEKEDAPEGETGKAQKPATGKPDVP
jgi:HEAT repeat protein